MHSSSRAIKKTIAPNRARQAQRFVISGLLVTGLHAVVAVAVMRFVLPVPTLANGVAFVTATLCSYAVNTLWSFSSSLNKNNLFRFILVSSVGLFLAVGVSGTAQYYELHYLVGIGLVACTVPPVTFLLHSFWTYRKDLQLTNIELD